jgi:gluconolactonase
MCLDADGNIVACAGSSGSGTGPMVYVFSPTGRVMETHPTPVDPINCTFGDADLTTFYMTGDGGGLYRVRNSGRKGWLIWPAAA